MAFLLQRQQRAQKLKTHFLSVTFHGFGTVILRFSSPGVTDFFYRFPFVRKNNYSSIFTKKIRKDLTISAKCAKLFFQTKTTQNARYKLIIRISVSTNRRKWLTTGKKPRVNFFILEGVYGYIP